MMDDSIDRSRLNNYKEEFSDESLFGEDRIEDLIERKSSNNILNAGGQRNTATTSQNMINPESSFKSRTGGANFMRAQEEMMNYSNQHTPGGASSRIPGGIQDSMPRNPSQ
jgi:hypothetical protein